MGTGRQAGDRGKASERRKFCARPFRHLEIAPNGEAYLCCQGWLPQAVGNVRRQATGEVWNGPVAQAVRRTMLDGSFRYCTACPFLETASGPVSYADEVTDPGEQAILQAGSPVAGPIVLLNLAYDRTCNLSCPSCRTELVVVGGDAYNNLLDLHRRLFEKDDLLAQIEWLYVTGSGDPFASRLFRSLLRSIDVARYPRLKVKLHTNGLLFTPDAWLELGPVRSRVADVEVSIDAATAATYAANRRGGDWSTLLQRLGFISTLRRDHALDCLQLSFVIQSNNWREMPAFADLGESLGVDRILFTALRNWGTFSEAEYRSRAVHRPGHPDHANFVRSLASASLQRSVVTLGDVARLRV